MKSITRPGILLIFIAVFYASQLTSAQNTEPPFLKYLNQETGGAWTSEHEIIEALSNNVVNVISDLLSTKEKLTFEKVKEPEEQEEIIAAKDRADR